MAEYIDREAVYREVCRGCTKKGLTVGSCYAEEPCWELIGSLTSAPAADVVEVVRCKDCKRCVPSGLVLLCSHALPTRAMTEYYTVGGTLFAKVKPDDFCSHGERRDDHEAD